uniref:Uncharacterized protein n=1 Tax=Plectus sambesii TaxID=2011161 RepID=A0A914VSZ8_9BILA
MRCWIAAAPSYCRSGATNNVGNPVGLTADPRVSQQTSVCRPASDLRALTKPKSLHLSCAERANRPRRCGLLRSSGSRRAARTLPSATYYTAPEARRPVDP